MERAEREPMDRIERGLLDGAEALRASPVESIAGRVLAHLPEERPRKRASRRLVLGLGLAVAASAALVLGLGAWRGTGPGVLLGKGRGIHN